MEPISTLVPPPKTGTVAFQQGLIFGLIQAVIASTILSLNAFVNSGSLGTALLLSALSFLTGLAAYFVSGILAAKQNGKVRTGVFAGMWTGGIYGIIGFIVSMVIFFQVTYPKLIDAAIASDLYTNISAYETTAQIAGIGFAIFGIFFAVGLGAGLGALGGLIGRNISPYKPVPAAPVYLAYPGQPVPYAPYPGQPAPYAPYPGQPTPYAPTTPAGQVYAEQVQAEQINPEQ